MFYLGRETTAGLHGEDELISWDASHSGDFSNE